MIYNSFTDVFVPFPYIFTVKDFNEYVLGQDQNHQIKTHAQARKWSRRIMLHLQPSCDVYLEPVIYTENNTVWKQ